MKEHPIIMSTEMVKAILNDSKTQTRRVLKPQPDTSGGLLSSAVAPFWLPPQEYINKYCRYKVGDRLWVKETFDYIVEHDGSLKYFYKADYNDTMPKDIYKWHPSIYLPRKASRLLLNITDIGLQRLQDITFEDVVAEGAEYMLSADIWEKELPNPVIVFLGYWNSINAKRGYGWDINPFVWRINFIKIEEENNDQTRKI